MAKKKESLISDIAFIGAALAAIFYGTSRMTQMFSSKPLEQRVEQAVAETPKVEAPVKALPEPKLEQKIDYSIAYDQKTNLAIVKNRDSFQFYGDRLAKGGKYKELDADLYELLMHMADAYKSEFKKPLFVGPMWDDQGHSKGSKHYEGKAADIDFGANIGTVGYKSDRPKAEFLLRYIQKYSKEHNKEFKVLFNDKDFINEGLCAYFEGHHNHIHVSK